MSDPQTIIAAITKALDRKIQGEPVTTIYRPEGLAIIAANALGLPHELPVSVLARRLAAGQRAEQCPDQAPEREGWIRYDRHRNGWADCRAWIRGEDQ